MGFGAIAAAGGSDAAGGGAQDPWGEAGNGYESFAVSCDDGLALATGDGAEDFADGFVSGHDQPCGHGFLRGSVQSAFVVDATDVGCDEAGADESEIHAGESEFGSDGIGQSADSEFAHGVGSGTGRGAPSGDTAEEDDVAARLLDGGKSGVNGAKKAEDIGLKLAAVIVE